LVDLVSIEIQGEKFSKKSKDRGYIVVLLDKEIISKEKEELSQSRTRLKISTFVVLYFFSTHFLLGKYTIEPCILFSLHWIYSVLNYYFVKRSGSVKTARVITSMSVDLGAITYSMHIMDTNGIVLYPLIIWIVVANGIRFGKKFLFLAAGIGELFFMVSLLTNPAWDAHRELLYSLAFGLMVLSSLFLQMIHRLHHLNETLEHKVEDRVAEVEYRYSHDSLTDLKNREALAQDLEKNAFGGIFVVDIDQFHNYNELYGMAVGDSVLLQMADFLQDFAKEKGYEVYRIYSDHFVLRDLQVYPSFVKIEDDILALFEKIEKFRINIEETGEILKIDITAGISLEKEKALKKAEMALKYAKKQKVPYIAYSQVIDSASHSQELLYWKDAIKKAIETDNILPLFQPIVDRSGEWIKYEALMRLRQFKDGKEELVSPFYFLEIAFKSKQYFKLTQIMVEKSFQFMQKSGVEASINLSFEDIVNKKITALLKERIAYYGIGDQVIFEIVESSDIEDFVKVKQFIAEFRKLGVRFAIDDFGTGYSNFSHLFELSPDYVKIDGSLVKNIATDQKSYLLVRAIVRLAKHMKIKTIAEFVSNEEIYDICYKLGVDYFQGYYFAEPLADKEVLHKIEHTVSA